MHTHQHLSTAVAASRRHRGRLLGGLLTAALALGCGPTPVADGSSFDVLIYVLDACRADRIGAYGYGRPTTPAIDALAADPDAVVYTRHYVASNWTKPATASLFTGTYVHQHRITSLHYQVQGRRYAAEVLADRFVTLAESFRDAGFATFGLVTSHHLAPSYGFDQGFDAYFDPEELKVGDLGRNSKLIDLIWDLDSAYFAYVHQNACHYPFGLRDRDPDFMAELGFGYDEASRRAAGIDFTTGAIRDAIFDGEAELTADDIRFLSLVYDAKLRKVDRQVVAPLIEELRRAGRWDRTLLIVTADHGEELYDHGGYAHGFAMWDEVIHVPLIVKFPRGMRPPALPREVTALTSNVDLFPSLLAFLGRPVPDGLAGRSIFAPPAAGLVRSQGSTGRHSTDSETWVVIEGREKLIVEERGRTHLFDLEADPGETDNLAESRSGRTAALAALVEAVRTGETAPEAPEIETELSPEAIEALRSLGYLD